MRTLTEPAFGAGLPPAAIRAGRGPAPLVRSTAFLVLCGLLTLALSGCKREEKARARATEEETPGLSAVVHVADPKTSFQLLKGFHALEQNSWRWTAGKFAVVLRTPAGAAKNGATLSVKLTIPEPITQRLGPVTLSAEVGNVALQPETYGQHGDYVYTRDVPASALPGQGATVNFTLDKVLGPGDVDDRELGIIVTTIGLEPR